MVYKIAVIIVVGIFCQVLQAQGPDLQKEIEFLEERQQKDGTFKIQGMQEYHSEGIYALAGLAIFSQKGFSTSVERLVKYFLKRQQEDGCFLRKNVFTKPMMQHAYITLFLLEIYIAYKDKKIKIDEDMAKAIEDAIIKACMFCIENQHKTGVWVYEPRRELFVGGYKESATWVAVMEVLGLAREYGIIELPASLIKKSLSYIHTRKIQKGFINGQWEAEVSPHITPAVASALCWFIDEKGVKGLIEDADEYISEQVKRGYLDEITGDIYNLPEPFVIRRKMYGLFYTALHFKRKADDEEFKEIHNAIVNTLIQNRVDGRWLSSIGDIGATAFAILTINIAKDNLVIFKKTMKRRRF